MCTWCGCYDLYYVFVLLFMFKQESKTILGLYEHHVR